MCMLKKIKMYKENNKVLDNEIGLHLEHVLKSYVVKY